MTAPHLPATFCRATAPPLLPFPQFYQRHPLVNAVHYHHPTPITIPRCAPYHARGLVDYALLPVWFKTFPLPWFAAHALARAHACALIPLPPPPPQPDPPTGFPVHTYLRAGADNTDAHTRTAHWLLPRGSSPSILPQTPHCCLDGYTRTAWTALTALLGLQRYAGLYSTHCWHTLLAAPHLLPHFVYCGSSGLVCYFTDIAARGSGRTTRDTPGWTARVLLTTWHTLPVYAINPYAHCVYHYLYHMPWFSAHPVGSTPAPLRAAADSRPLDTVAARFLRVAGPLRFYPRVLRRYDLFTYASAHYITRYWFCRVSV